jgi:hypothetical protein
LFFVYIQLPSEYCEQHYCLPILEIGDFIACTLAIIGLGVVVVSLDAWKSGQQYIEKRELMLNTKNELLTIKNEFFKDYIFDPVYDHLSFLSITGQSANALGNLKKLKLNPVNIAKFETNRANVLRLISTQVIHPSPSGDIDIGRECAFLLASIQECIQDLDILIEQETLGF